MADSLKVRIGIGSSTTATSDAARFASIVDRCEQLGFDSLWVSERVNADAPDPLIALAVAAARTTRMKFGTSVLVLPGRNPVLTAKEMATLDVLSGGRFLPATGLGAVDPPEQQAFGVRREERGRRHDEMLEIMRRCWTGDRFSHHGEFFDIDDVEVLPRPIAGGFDVWLGGIAPSELRRVARVGDGWLPSFVSPADVADGIATITRTAGELGRTIDPQHFGVLLAYSDGELPSRLAEVIERRRPGTDIRSVIPSLDDLPRLVSEFVAAGASKFVITPLGAELDPDREFGLLANALLPLST